MSAYVENLAWSFNKLNWIGLNWHWVKYENINNSDLHGIMSLASFCQSNWLQLHVQNRLSWALHNFYRDDRMDYNAVHISEAIYTNFYVKHYLEKYMSL